MGKFLASMLSGLILLGLGIGLVQAREAASYAQALEMSRDLSQQDYDQMDKEVIRKKAVGLAHVINNFTLNEAEQRAQSKVEPPLAALARPGEAPKADLLNLPAGETVAINEVPDRWFLGMMDAARTKMRQMITELEQPAPAGQRLKLLAGEIHRNLVLVARPPNQ